jgi:hypothetical protein
LIAGIGLLRGRKWAWWFAIGLLAINGCGDEVSFIVTRDAVRSASGILICSVFVFLLSHNRVRFFFRAARRTGQIPHVQHSKPEHGGMIGIKGFLEFYVYSGSTPHTGGIYRQA